MSKKMVDEKKDPCRYLPLTIRSRIMACTLWRTPSGGAAPKALLEWYGEKLWTATDLINPEDYQKLQNQMEDIFNRNTRMLGVAENLAMVILSIIKNTKRNYEDLAVIKSITREEIRTQHVNT